MLFPIIIGATSVLLFAILYIPPFANFFQVTALELQEIGVTLMISTVVVMWFEVYKWLKMVRQNDNYNEK